MSKSSIGSGTPEDSNENHPQDDSPSKTFGAEGGGIPAGSGLPGQPVTTEQAINLNNPGNFPDGPNVAPSPWEKDAAEGKPTP